MQEHAEGVLLKYLSDYGEERKIGQGAILLTRYDGAVITMIGGRDFSQSQFNRAVQAKRSPGSSFKPVVYLSALENGYDPNDMIEDAPLTIGNYTPENYGGKYYGVVSLETALAYSLNTVAVRLMHEVGRQNVINTARRIGIISDLPNDLSVALGSAGISMLEMTAAYGSIANGGLAVYPYAITRIRDKDGTVYYERPKRTVTRRVIEPRADRQLRGMMQGVIEYGTGRGADPGFTAAGKTGPSQDSRDAWFIGFSSDVVASVWVGNDDNSPMKNVTGGSIPAQIWRDVMVSAQSRHGGRDSFMGIENSDGGFSGLMGRLLGSTSNDSAPDAPQIEWNSGRVPPSVDIDEAHTENERYND